MSYTPTNWQLGDIVTPEKLNKMEQGIADAGSSGSSDMIIPVFTKNGTTYTCDMTFAEIAAEISNGKKLAGCVVAEVLNGQVSLEYFMRTISYLKDAFAQFSSTSINGVNGSFTATLSYEVDNTVTFERNTITIPSAPLIVKIADSTMDKTFAEIRNAFNENRVVKFYQASSSFITEYIFCGLNYENPMSITLNSIDNMVAGDDHIYFYANSSSEYPSQNTVPTIQEI